MNKIFKRVGIVVLVMVIALIVSPSREERAKAKNAEIEMIKKEISTISELEVEKNLDLYMRILKYFPKDETYISQKNKFEKMAHNEAICREKGREYNKNSLLNIETYEGIETDRFNKWITKNEFITSSSFIGKNSYGVKQKFSAQYKCTIVSNGIEIKKMFLKTI